MTHYVVDQLHLILRITDRLWELALNECKNNGHFVDEMRELICEEMRVIGVKFKFWKDQETKK